MNATRAILTHLLEAEEEDFPLKDVTEPPEVPSAGPTTVKSYKIGRMKVVDMPMFTFLISYLTPVAYYDKRLGTYYVTSKQWSPTTNGHIREWQRMIWKSPKHQADQRYWEQSSVKPEDHYVRFPDFHKKRQSQISSLFRQLIGSMEMKPGVKARLYRVDPRMRTGNVAGAHRWVGGHLKHHDTGEQGLPRPGEEGFEEFFKGFDPDDPEYWDWQQSERRSQEPYDPDEPKR